MPQYCYRCVKCSHVQVDFRLVSDRDNPTSCEKCRSESKRDFFSERVNTPKDFHKPIEMLSIACNPQDSMEMQQILGPDITVRNGVPIAHNRREKLYILDKLGYQEAN